MNMKVNAVKIRKWREQRCWSQEQVAEIASISLRTVQRIENGGTASHDSVMALAAAFDEDVSALILDVDTEVGKTVEREEAKKFLEFKMSFGIHLVTYLFVMGILLLVDLADRPEEFWVFWPAAGWGIGVLAHGVTVYLVSYISRMDKQIRELGQ